MYLVMFVHLKMCADSTQSLGQRNNTPTISDHCRREPNCGLGDCHIRDEGCNRNLTIQWTVNWFEKVKQLSHAWDAVLTEVVRQQLENFTISCTHHTITCNTPEEGDRATPKTIKQANLSSMKHFKI